MKRYGRLKNNFITLIKLSNTKPKYGEWVEIDENVKKYSQKTEKGYLPPRSRTLIKKNGDYIIGVIENSMLPVDGFEEIEIENTPEIGSKFINDKYTPPTKKRIAEIENGVVKNITIGYEEIPGMHVLDDNEVGIGWLYNGKKFLPPKKIENQGE